MVRRDFGALAALALSVSSPAFAHVIAGSRVFPVTLTIDDPGTADEVSIPAFSYTRDGVQDGSGPTHHFNFGFEYDKTITSNTAIIFNDGYNLQQINGSKNQGGWQNLFITGKWQAYTNAEHEFVTSLGIIREIGGTGTSHIGADRYGSTAPTVYFGKGLGDIPVDFVRPFAVTGEFGYSIADIKLKQFQTQQSPLTANSPLAGGVATQFNAGANNAWAAGMSLQYSIPYLQSQVKDYHLPDFIGNLIPLVEVTWSSPAGTPSSVGTTWQVAPGVIYLAQWGEIGVEALIPLNRTTGTNVGAVALVHFFLDDLMPHTLGKPIFQ